MFALAKPGGINLYQKVMKTPGFTGKPGAFLELVTWLEQATFSLRVVAHGLATCFLNHYCSGNLAFHRNSPQKQRIIVTIKFYRFLSFSKSGRQRVDIFPGSFLDYKATFPCTCRCKSMGACFSTHCTISNIWVDIVQERNFLIR